MWASRGYVGFSMDLSGSGEDGERLRDGGPAQDQDSKFRQMDKPFNAHWLYHSVAAVIRANSLLRSLSEVDRDRIGITGISWGGILTCIVAGLDQRFRLAVPVYGCGFLYENGTLSHVLDSLSPKHRKRWIECYDPSRYLAKVSVPTLWVNGTNDKHFPMDIFQKSYNLVRKHRTLCVKVGMKHSHQDGWNPIEIGIFSDQVLRGGGALPRIVRVEHRDFYMEATIQSPLEIVSGRLHFTGDDGPFQDRSWESINAEVKGNRARVQIPCFRPVTYFLSVTDKRGATVSTKYESSEQNS